MLLCVPINVLWPFLYGRIHLFYLTFSVFLGAGGGHTKIT